MQSKTMKKTINRLSNYIGKEIIRIQPTYEKDWDYEDWSYTEEPILLLGFTTDGRIRYKHTKEIWLYGDREKVLPASFTDMNWITYKKALRSGGNNLNKWKGKKIIRINPTVKGSMSFMKEPVVLISASRYHMVVLYDNKPMVLNREYAEFKDWILA